MAQYGKFGGQLLFVVIHVLHDLFVTSAGTFIPEIELWSPEKLSSAAILLILIANSSSLTSLITISSTTSLVQLSSRGLMRMMTAFNLSLHPAPDRAASRSSILNVAFFGAMTQLRGTPLTQRHLFWLEEFLFSSEALNFRVPLSYKKASKQMQVHMISLEGSNCLIFATVQLTLLLKLATNAYLEIKSKSFGWNWFSSYQLIVYIE